MDTIAGLRLGCALGVLLLLLAAERGWPRRRPRPRWRWRWTANVGMSLLAAALVRLLLGAGAVGAAAFAQHRGWGLFAQLAWPVWLEFALTLLLLDLLIYAQHRTLHTVPLLWRLHRVHHCDLQLDATTGLRFHPAEILLSMLLKMAATLALGATPLAVLVFEILLNACSMFTHANLALPPRLERALRPLLITPDLHRVHHSIHRDETCSNYGFSVPWWDRLFRSYRAQPRDGHEAMTLGLPAFRDAAQQRTLALLLQPLKKE